MIIKTRNVRYIFAVLALLAVILTGYNFYFIYPKFTEILVKNVEDEATRLSTHLSATYFPDNMDLTEHDIMQMEITVNTLINDFALMKMKAYSPAGEVFYSTDEIDVGQLNESDFFYNTVAEGHTHTVLVKNDMLDDEGQEVVSDVLEIYVPVMYQGEFIGAFEMHFDITSQLASSDGVINKSILVLVIMLVCGLSLTTLMMVQLDRSILKQQEIEEELKIFSGKLNKSNMELKSFSDKLHRINRELESFAHTASHDLQEPLRKVAAFGDRLKTRYADKLGEQGIDYVNRMQGATKRMQQLIDGLLMYSRVTTKAQPFEAVDLSTITSEVISDLEVRIQEKSGTVEVEELPSVSADPLQMRQLFQNLIGNALKFHREGEPPAVRISASLVHDMEESSGTVNPDSEVCRITFKDNGIGFKEEYAERIFGVFQRLHGRSEFEGSGIGLSVCKKIVERHGGSIEAKSVPGEGATFIIDLPIGHAVAADA